ncbi:MAG TPA: NAD(P)H-hydrate dehydratase [Pedobacter sp.]|nr:NAD(P)H-hydrate dehydratase [Pedobacter sp.]
MKTKLNDFLPDASATEDSYVINGIEGPGDYRLIMPEDIGRLFKPRVPFSHKGTYGHALIIAGAPQTMGAALLSAMGCLYAGAGLTTAAIPESGLSALNAALPEVMYADKKQLLENKTILKTYSAIAVGPGLTNSNGHSLDHIELLYELLRQKLPIVADADALTLLKGKLRSIPKKSILTPHVKEFDRLFGAHKTWWERLQTARLKARKMEVVIVLKNQYTFIIDQQGLVFINPTGNPAMAQGGMGDVLTGIITAYVAQGYQPATAAMLGCYFHGRAGNELAESRFNVTASQVAMQLPVTINGFPDPKK